jgi:hypothetical protein
VQRLQIELLGRLCRDELHSRALAPASVIASASRKSFFCPLEYGRTYFAGIRPSVVSEHLQLAAQMMRADASLHADETRRQVGQPCFHLPARPLLRSTIATTLIETHDVKRVLADIDTDHGDSRIELV